MLCDKPAPTGLSFVLATAEPTMVVAARAAVAARQNRHSTLAALAAYTGGRTYLAQQVAARARRYRVNQDLAAAGPIAHQAPAVLPAPSAKTHAAYGDVTGPKEHSVVARRVGGPGEITPGRCATLLAGQRTRSAVRRCRPTT
jgi:hypothetical protein